MGRRRCDSVMVPWLWCSSRPNAVDPDDASSVYSTPGPPASGRAGNTAPMRTQSRLAVDARTVPSDPSSLAIDEMPRKPRLPTSTVHSTLPG